VSDETTDMVATDRGMAAEDSTATVTDQNFSIEDTEHVADSIAPCEGIEAARTSPNYTAHPAAEVYPLMTGEAFAELVADITKNGLRHPIVLFKDRILDGRNRDRACLEAGIALKTVEFVGDDKAAEAFVHSANLHRRHLTQAEKQNVVVKILAAQPKTSDRQIARLAHVDHKTVGAKRAALEDSGEIARVERREDTKGRSYRVHSKTPAGRSSARLAVEPTEKDEEPETNTILAFARLLNEGDINRHLNNFLRLLGGDIKKRLNALPKDQREALARGFLAVLELHADDLRPILDGESAATFH
jgi:DNA-binding MarR family transcriptional regulator